MNIRLLNLRVKENIFRLVSFLAKNIFPILHTALLLGIFLFTFFIWRHIRADDIFLMGLFQTQLGLYHKGEKTLYVYDDSGKYMLRYSWDGKKLRTRTR